MYFILFSQISSLGTLHNLSSKGGKDSDFEMLSVGSDLLSVVEVAKWSTLPSDAKFISGFSNREVVDKSIRLTYWVQIEVFFSFSLCFYVPCESLSWLIVYVLCVFLIHVGLIVQLGYLSASYFVSTQLGRVEGPSESMSSQVEVISKELVMLNPS